MIVYHGSYIEIRDPDLKHSREDVDFGKGFYTTTLHDQAQRWCNRFKRRGKEAYISRYHFDERAFEKLKF